MNTLSWLLYTVDILIKFNNLMTPILVVTFMFVIIPLIACSFYYETEVDYVDHQRVWKKIYPLNPISWHLRWFLPLWLIILFVILLIPSKETIYMIAASQVGEQVVQLKEVQEIGGDVGGLAKDAIELLRQNIQEQLTEKPVEAD